MAITGPEKFLAFLWQVATSRVRHYASTYVICKPLAGTNVISKTVTGIKLISKHVSTAPEYT